MLAASDRRATKPVVSGTSRAKGVYLFGALVTSALMVGGCSLFDMTASLLTEEPAVVRDQGGDAPVRDLPRIDRTRADQGRRDAPAVDLPLKPDRPHPDARPFRRRR